MGSTNMVALMEVVGLLFLLHLAAADHCALTRYPGRCRQALLELKGSRHSTNLVVDHQNNTVTTVLSALVRKTISETNSHFTVLDSHLETSQADHRAHQSASEYCKNLTGMSLKRLDQSLSALENSPTKSKHDIQTWLSSVLTFHQACMDSIDATPTADVASRRMNYLSELTSNALSLANRITTSTTTTTTTFTASSKSGKISSGDVAGFPEWVSTKNRKLLQSGGGGGAIKANAVVAKDGTGNYETISAAMAAASGRSRFVIYVKAGVYKEKIHSNKDQITLVGDGKYATVIVGSDSVKGGFTMPDTATFTITGDGFIARDIGFQNTAGPGGEQAVALYAASDRSVFYRCSMAGYQDTLYALALRQFYRECDIAGTIDFIFGNAAAVFQSCNVVLRRPRSGNSNVIIANGRTDPGQTTGFSLQACRISSGSDLAPVKGSFDSYLGRPWKQYSRAVVMESTIDGEISSQGWAAWPGQGGYSKTLYFGEYSNSGPGAGTSGRVKWAGHHVMGPQEAAKFTVGSLIAGSSWLPSTGVTFVAGL